MTQHTQTYGPLMAATTQSTGLAEDGITRRAGLLTLLGGALSLAGCGGGGGASPVVGAGGAVAGSGALTLGPITGFGSIILNGNGVRIDDSRASVSDDDGNDMRGKLKIGMQVAVVSAADASGAVVAQSITTHGELQGRIEGAPDAALKTFVVLGQTVKVAASTVFDASLPNGFASLAADGMVEVHGVLNAADNSLAASFIEKKTSPANFKIQGLVSNLDKAAKKFKIGSLVVNYANTADIRVTLADGALVRVPFAAVLPPAPLPAEWAATRIRGAEHMAEDRAEFEVEGSITSFTSAQAFSVNGVPVDASGVVVAPAVATGLKLGARVEVKGKLTAGVLVATRVKLDDESEIDNREVELHGSVADAAAGSFTLRGLVVEWDNTTQFRKGTSAGLVTGAKVEVKGAAAAGNSSTKIKATRITFE